MKNNLIRRLNELNRQFYQQTAADFSSSRSYYWQGWNKLVPYLKKLDQNSRGQIRILDLGCGNGRFGIFLAIQLPQLKMFYVGVDNSQELLQVAKIRHTNQQIQAQLVKLDLVELLLTGKLLVELKPFKPDFISALGLLHHIPSLKLRAQLMADLGQVVNENGYLTFTTWNFLENKRFKKKIMDPAKFDLNPDELEENDVILDWQRGQTAHRYCHYTDRTELQQLIHTSDLKKISQFKADGKNGKLNTYTVLQKVVE